MNWLQEFADLRKAQNPDNPAALDVTRQALAILYRAGFVVMEANGRRLILSPNGQFDEGERQAARNAGDLLAGAFPEAGQPCPQCRGAGFVIAPDLSRTCINCEPLPGIVERNARGVARAMTERGG